MIANRSAVSPLSLFTNRKHVAILCLAQCMLLSVYVLAKKDRIISFDPPGSRQTFPVGVNDRGSVTGYYSDGSAFHGFLRTPDGRFTAIDGPGATATYALSINSAGWIAGYFFASNMSHGFLRGPHGWWFITFDPPGSTGTMP